MKSLYNSHMHNSSEKKIFGFNQSKTVAYCQNYLKYSNLSPIYAHCVHRKIA